MSIEIEKKYSITVKQNEQIAQTLEEFEARFIREDFEVNIIFTGGILTEKKSVLRVRKIDGKNLLTFKQRIENKSEIKHQIEFETEIQDAEEIEKIIESLGFEKSLVYEKRRKIWQFENVEIVLDELPFGLFMEIEGSVKAIKNAELKLGAGHFKTEHGAYPQLTAKLGKKNGNFTEARFD